MRTNGYHLTYCTNIHPGETWAETFSALKKFIPDIKKEVSPNAPFGIGLRLSDKASRSLLKEDELAVFRSWLNENDCYVFTLNGFPFGGFHYQVVKDQVHHPDWTSLARLDYTRRLFDILSALLPDGMEGGISTSPLSYKFWEASMNDKKEVMREATHNIIEIAAKLHDVYKNDQKVLHLDIEPEPDGILENTREVIDWYREWLIPQGTAYLLKKFSVSEKEAENILKKHIRLCYDVCHFAIVYEKPKEVFSLLKEEGIQIGKIQLSAALKVQLPKEIHQRNGIKDALSPFMESTYLHQVVERDSRGNLTHYPDLPQALENLDKPASKEWRTHFHVPVFLDSYGRLDSTQEDILEVLQYLKIEKVTEHLEVETYTWEVLPDDIQLEIVNSIVRELQWVKKNM